MTFTREQPVPPEFPVLCWHIGRDFEESPALSIERKTEPLSTASVTDISSGYRHKNLSILVSQVLEYVKSTELWLNKSDQIISRFDRHVTAVASKNLCTDSINQYIRDNDKIKRNINEIILLLMFDASGEKSLKGDESDSLVTASQRLNRLRYDIVLKDRFQSFGFESTDAYVDPAGGLVVDYFRQSDRVTLVFDKDDLQVLVYYNGDFKDQVFSPISTSQMAVKDFLENILSTE